MTTTRNGGNAVLVNPPKHEAILFGAAAAKITARRVCLTDDMGKVLESRAYTGMKPAAMKFSELVTFVRQGHRPDER